MTFKVDVSALGLGIINFWSTSVSSTVYLNLTKVPSYKVTLEKVKTPSTGVVVISSLLIY